MHLNHVPADPQVGHSVYSVRHGTGARAIGDVLKSVPGDAGSQPCRRSC